MPGLEELAGIFVIIFLLWFVLKMARVAIRLILFLAGLALAIGVLYFVLVR